MSENTETTGEVVNDTAEAGDNTQAAQAFTQDDVNRIVQERLVREREKFQGFDEFKAAAERLASVEAEKRQLAERVAAYEQQEQLSAIVAEVAAEKGVPASALRGSSREELTQHADELRAAFPSVPVIQGQANRPNHVSAEPLAEFARGLFEKAKNE